jgi:antitoxin MazE
MSTILRTRIIRIGNSQGIRIPKHLLGQSNLGDEVELEVQADQIVIRPARHARQGWDEAFSRMAEQGDDRLLDGNIATAAEWDEGEWEW